jgi:hypothetical protein
MDIQAVTALSVMASVEREHRRSRIGYLGVPFAIGFIVGMPLVRMLM